MNFNAAFWKWFGDSKVVKQDRDRTPLIVYHGTDKKFSHFEQRGGTIATILSVEKVQRTGFFFTTKRGVSELFAGKGGFVMPCYLSIQHPADFTKNERKLDDDLEAHGINLRWLNETGEMWEKFDGEDGAALVKACKLAGYDGAIIKEYITEIAENVTVYIAFDPRQVKSATGNDGSWDSDDADIRSNPSAVSVSLKDVIEYLNTTDGTGDPEWVDELIDMVKPYKKWKNGIVPLDDIENHNDSSKKQLRPYLELSDDEWADVVLIPSENPQYKWFVIDGGHRAAALTELTKEKVIGALYPEI